ncbi:hypothetical protein CEXT_448381 [Caerostris extrusa]|uniref:Uncharacterized protein n=1 Tax=Caerostris extrusa TaxID=172846 RepID=A0AAV4NGX7_CAEEX|nr:hypothetical protein CEXT_448381 [Caerostris extrusa]
MDRTFLEPSRGLSEAVECCIYADSSTCTTLHRDKSATYSRGDRDFITKSSEKFSATKTNRAACERDKPADNWNNKIISAETVIVNDSSLVWQHVSFLFRELLTRVCSS